MKELKIGERYTLLDKSSGEKIEAIYLYSNLESDDVDESIKWWVDVYWSVTNKEEIKVDNGDTEWGIERIE